MELVNIHCDVILRENCFIIFISLTCPLSHSFLILWFFNLFPIFPSIFSFQSLCSPRLSSALSGSYLCLVSFMSHVSDLVKNIFIDYAKGKGSRRQTAWGFPYLDVYAKKKIKANGRIFA